MGENFESKKYCEFFFIATRLWQNDFKRCIDKFQSAQIKTFEIKIKEWNRFLTLEYQL